MLLAFLCLPATAFGQVNAKTAVTMMQQAAKAYEAGDFAKAAEWYGKAWRLDPLPAYLWALARAEHLGAMFEPATEHYREFIALPAADAARVAKAHQYLVETEAEAVKTRVRDADAATSGGKPALAAELYLRALKVFPTRLDLLFNAAVAEQMAEQWQPALAHQDEYLGKAPADAPDRPQALTRRGWLRQKLGLAPQAIPPPVAVSPPPVVPSVVVKPAPAPPLMMPPRVRALALSVIVRVAAPSATAPVPRLRLLPATEPAYVKSPFIVIALAFAIVTGVTGTPLKAVLSIVVPLPMVKVLAVAPNAVLLLIFNVPPLRFVPPV